MKYKDIKIEKHSQITYLGCVLDESLCVEPMILKALKQINGKLKLKKIKNKFLRPTLCKMLYNALIQPHLDFCYSAWYSTLNEKLYMKMKIAQSKCIRFCLDLDKRHDISSKEFETISWFSAFKRMH